MKRYEREPNLDNSLNSSPHPLDSHAVLLLVEYSFRFTSVMIKHRGRLEHAFRVVGWYFPE